jgi:uncharacterized membrane protein
MHSLIRVQNEQKNNNICDNRLLLSIGIVLYCQNFVLPQLYSDRVEVSFNWSPLQVNVTQGESFVVNGTLFNESYNQTTNAGLGYQLACIDNVSYWENASIWGQILNATFTPNPVFLEPHQVKSIELTITIAKDAPTGEYQVFLQGKEPENSTLYILVTPKNIL